MKMYVISDNNDTCTGMRLAGVGGAVVHTQEELKSELDKALDDKELGVLLIVEKLANQFPDIVESIRLSRRLPLIVEIPDRHGTERTADFISEYIKEAIGIKM